MTRMDKLMILGAWALMAAVGIFGVWKTAQAPRIDPGIAKLIKELEKLQNEPAPPWHDERTHWNGLAYFGPVANARPANDRAGSLSVKLIPHPLPHPEFPVSILSLPIPGAAKTDLDGTRISWTITEPEVALLSWMKRTNAKPAGFILRRQCEEGPVEKIAELGADARSYVDLSTLPRKTYRYWVLATGKESLLTVDPPVLQAVTKGSEKSAETRTPSATRVKLVGGDKTSAILRVETYDRTQKKWIGPIVTAAPGKEVGSSGWTLNGLRFDNFTLVADVSDDGGVDRVLTTKD